MTPPIEQLVNTHRTNYQNGDAALQAVQNQLYLDLHDLAEGDWTRFRDDNELRGQAESVINQSYSLHNSRLPFSEEYRQKLLDAEGVDAYARHSIEKVLFSYKDAIKQTLRQGEASSFADLQMRAHIQATRPAWSGLVGQEFVEETASNTHELQAAFAKRYGLGDPLDTKYSARKLSELFRNGETMGEFIREELKEADVKDRIKKEEGDEQLVNLATPEETARFLQELRTQNQE